MDNREVNGIKAGGRWTTTGHENCWLQLQMQMLMALMMMMVLKEEGKGGPLVFEE
jgi:hypothetical protein